MFLVLYCSLISWELTDLRMRGKNNCLRITKAIITFPWVSRKQSWAKEKQKTPRNQSKLSFHRMSPKISEWNWILWRALGLHKTKAAAVVMIKLFESDNPLSPKILSSHFLLFSGLGLPPKLGCHHKNIRSIQVINYLKPAHSLSPLILIAGRITFLAHCLDHINLLLDHLHWISCHIYNVIVNHQ